MMGRRCVACFVHGFLQVEYCIEHCGTLRSYEGHCAKLRPMTSHTQIEPVVLPD